MLGKHKAKHFKNNSVKKIDICIVLIITSMLLFYSMQISNIMAYFISHDRIINTFILADHKTITYNNNTGTGTMSTQIIYSGTSKNLLANTYTKTGYTFSNWNTEPDGTGSNYTDKQSVSINQDLMLYAQWDANQYTVRFDANGGTGTMENMNFSYDEAKNLNQNTFTRNGSEFLCWNTMANGSGTRYNDESEVSNLTAEDGDVITLYAQWKTGSYIIEYDANSGTGTMNNQEVTYDKTVNLTANTFAKEGYIFTNWNTKADGTGESYRDKQSVVNVGNIRLYAQWEVEDRVAEIDGTYYPSLQNAINAVPKNNTKTKVKLLRDISEKLTVSKNQNIEFDFQMFELSNVNAKDPLMENFGTIEISNGTIKTSAVSGAINNKSNATLKMSGGSIIATGGRQAIYNEGGTVEISGSTYLTSNASGTYSGMSRSTLQNLSGGTMIVTGGTIISTKEYAMTNAGTLTIGTKDDIIDKNTPVIQGIGYGLQSSKSFNFYDGIIKGKTNAINDVTKVGDTEVGYQVIHDEETINGAIYKVAYLGEGEVVIFNPNGGTVNETTRTVELGTNIKTLPTPTREGYRFDGWFTLPEGGEQITSETIVTGDVTYYAHWTRVMAAEISGTEYITLDAAIKAVPTDNTETTIKILRDINENVVVSTGQNIVFNLQNYKISNSNNNKSVITNNGTIQISNGTIESNIEFATIDNNAGAVLKVSGGNIISNGSRSSIYNNGGIVEISGTAYLSSTATGQPATALLERGTIHNYKGTVIITGGTIIGVNQQAVSNESTLIVGTKDGNINAGTPVIIGNTYGIKNIKTFSFYDGIVKGKTGAIDGTITATEDNSTQVDTEETIDTVLYQVTYLLEEE